MDIEAMLGKDLTVEQIMSTIGQNPFNETKDDRQARGKAECSSAAVEMLNARNVVDEL